MRRADPQNNGEVYWKNSVPIGDLNLAFIHRIIFVHGEKMVCFDLNLVLILVPVKDECCGSTFLRPGQAGSREGLGEERPHHNKATRLRPT